MAAAPHIPLLPHKLWTRHECEQIASFVDLDQYELIEGELVQKMGKNQPHSRALLLVLNWLQSVFGNLNVLPDSSIDVSPEDNPTSEPEPDLFVVRQSYLELARRPRPVDLALVVEISASTLAFDLTLKRDLYARAEIAEYWVVDVTGRRVIIHREPVCGTYRFVQAYGEEESVAPLATPHRSTLVRDLV